MAADEPRFHARNGVRRQNDQNVVRRAACGAGMNAAPRPDEDSVQLTRICATPSRNRASLRPMGGQTMKNVLIGVVVFAVVMSFSILLILPKGPTYTALAMALAYVAMHLTWNIRHDRLPPPTIIGKVAVLGVVMFAMVWGIQRYVTGPFFS
jgi:hypothetical protein